MKTWNEAHRVKNSTVSGDGRKMKKMQPFQQSTSEKSSQRYGMIDLYFYLISYHFMLLAKAFEQF